VFSCEAFTYGGVPDSHVQTTRKIVELLHAARKQRGVSQEGLAVMAGVSPSCIQHLEHARSTPTLLTILKLADALQLNPADLLRAALEDVL
jgi:transcriptional regulator with XRE-family HTH domain